MTTTRRPRALGALLLSLGLTLLAGCGPGAADAVSGAVTYNGRPVEEGVLNLRSAAGNAASARISGGRYAMAGPLAPGDYQAFVTPPLPEPQPPGKAVAKAPPSPLPARFRDPAGSGVVVTLKAGKNEVPIELKD